MVIVLAISAAIVYLRKRKKTGILEDREWEDEEMEENPWVEVEEEELSEFPQSSPPESHMTHGRMVYCEDD